MTQEVLTQEVLIGNTNTIKTSSIKSTSFQLTLNQPEKYNDVKEYLLNLKSFKYLISCKEKAPTTGHEHIHIYIHFKHSIKLSINKLSGAHIEKCFGSPKQNINYIKKDGYILDEIGEEPKQGKNYNYNEIIHINQKDILNDEQLNITQKKTIINIKNSIVPLINKKNNTKDIKIYFLWGHNRKKLYDKALSLIDNEEYYDEIEYYDGFFNGASNNCTTCILKDFDYTKMKLNIFEDFIDDKIHNLNIKSSIIKNFYNKIIILNNDTIDNIYDNYFKDTFLEDINHYEYLVF